MTMNREQSNVKFVTHTVGDSEEFSLELFHTAEDVASGKPHKTLRSIDELLDFNDALGE